MSQLKVNGVMMIALLALGVGFLGWVLPGISVHRIGRIGTASCTTNAATGSCTVTITYTSALSTAPCTGCYSLTFVNPIAPNTVVTTVSRGVYFAVESAGTAWLNMPAGPSEIFGDTGQHWLQVDLTNGLQAQLCVNLLTPGLGGESLNGQYSTDGGSTWNTLGAGVPIDGSTGTNPTCEAYTTIPVPARITTTLWRVIGSNGQGVGDNPAFTIIYEQFQYSKTFASTFSTWFTTAPGASSATVGIRTASLSAQSETVNYQVYICSDGSSTC